MNKRLRRQMKQNVRRMAATDRLVTPINAAGTYWNGEACIARRVRVRVGTVPVSTWWCAGMEGTEREAVEVTYGTSRFFLENKNGSGWAKVTTGRGSPWVGHSSLPSSPHPNRAERRGLKLRYITAVLSTTLEADTWQRSE